MLFLKIIATYSKIEKDLMINPSELTVRSLSKDSFSTGIDLSLVRRLMLLPPNVRGSRIVDIGAGVSSLTAELRAEGADAYAVDAKYASETEIRESVHPVYQNSRMTDMFFQDYHDHRDHYHRTLIGHEPLPFEDNSVDYILSGKFLSTILLNDWESFCRAYEECIRVLKPCEHPLDEGVLVIEPWTGGLSMSEVHAVHAYQFQQVLKDDPRVFARIVSNGEYLSPKLVIVKRPPHLLVR